MVQLWKLAVLFLTCGPLLTGGDFEEEYPVVEKFLSTFQNVRQSVLFLCDYKNGKISYSATLYYNYYQSLNLSSAFDYATKITSHGIFVNIVIPSSRMDITKVLPRTSYSKCGLIIDTNCSVADIALREVSMKVTSFVKDLFGYSRSSFVLFSFAVVAV